MPRVHLSAHLGNARHRVRAYLGGHATADVVAALIVTVLLVPQSLAYAMLAGLDPVVGIMASLLPIVAYAALGSSSTLAVGPVAILAVMTLQAVGPVADAHGAAAHLVAMVLAIEIAALLALAAALRLDTLAALLSAPVLHGFMTGAAVAIAIGQLPSLLGLPPANAGFAAWATAFASGGLAIVHPATAVIGLAALGLLWSIRRWGVRAARALGLGAKAAPLAVRTAPLLVVSLGIVAVLAGQGAADGVATVGPISLGDGVGYPWFWTAPVAVWTDLLPSAAVIALVAFVESLAVAESLAARRGDKVLPRRELLGLAAANAGAGIGGGMPVTGGFARSIVNFDAGARTKMAGVFTAVLLAGTVTLAAPALSHLPKAVLAATIVIAVTSLIELGPFRKAWRYSRLEFLVMLGVGVLTVVQGVEPALLAGVALSIGILLQRTARPHWAEIGRLPGTDVFRNVRRHRVETLPHVLSIRIDEALLFTNSRWLSEMILGQLKQRPRVQEVLLMMTGVNDIDLTGLEDLCSLDDKLRAEGKRLHLSELKGPVADRLAAVGVDLSLSGRIFQTQAAAWSALTGSGGAHGADLRCA